MESKSAESHETKSLESHEGEIAGITYMRAKSEIARIPGRKKATMPERIP
jgi:hypothetical protein